MTASYLRADIIYAGTESIGHDVDRISSAGAVSVFARLPPDSFFAEGLAFDANGDLFTADDNTDQISKITPAGTVSLFATLPSGSSPAGLAFDSGGNLYAANNGHTKSIRLRRTER